VQHPSLPRFKRFSLGRDTNFARWEYSVRCLIYLCGVGVLSYTGLMTTQMGADGARRFDSHGLIDLASKNGYALTTRMLETFRDQGLMPRTERSGNRGRAPIWRYPVGAEKQLLLLLRWREYTTKPRTLEVLLWLGGYPIPLNHVRSSVVEFLSDLQREIDLQLALAADIEVEQLTDRKARQAAIQASAQVLERKKELNAVLPRTFGGTPEDRATAIEDLMSAFLTGSVAAPTEARAEAVEKLMGVDIGRQPTAIGPAWLTGPATDLFVTLGEVNLHSMLAAAQGATDPQWRAARPNAEAMVRFLPVIVGMMRAMTGEDNPAGWGMLGGLNNEPDSALLILALMLTMGTRSVGDPDAVATTLREQGDKRVEIRALLAVPEEEVNHNLAKQPPEVAAQARRIIDSAKRGDLAPNPVKDPTRRPKSRRS
jgi:hypothetical protein